MFGSDHGRFPGNALLGHRDRALSTATNVWTLRISPPRPGILILRPIG
jgi:hypothetical protein